MKPLLVFVIANNSDPINFHDPRLSVASLIICWLPCDFVLLIFVHQPYS